MTITYNKSVHKDSELLLKKPYPEPKPEQRSRLTYQDMNTYLNNCETERTAVNVVQV